MIDPFWVIAYIIGTLAGFYISTYLKQDNVNILIDHLVSEGFLRHKKDEDGNIIILKWHDSRN